MHVILDLSKHLQYCQAGMSMMRFKVILLNL